MTEQVTADQLFRGICPDCGKPFVSDQPIVPDEVCHECWENWDGMTLEELIGE